MPTSKKTASKKKAPAKTTKAAGHKITFALDAEKAAAIRRCLAKGTLRVTVNKADLLRGRIRDAWIYD